MTTQDSPHGMDPHNREHDDSTIRRGPTGSEETLTPAELALSRLLRDAVESIEPTPDALHRLRGAIPARRAHRRQLLVGTVAAGLLAVAAIPAALHAADSSRGTAANTANTSSSHDEGGAGGAKGANATPRPSAPVGPVGGGGKQYSGGTTGPRSPVATAAPGAGAGDATPASTAGATVSACTGADLGDPVGFAGVPASDGTVYGWFKVSNTSSAACVITGVGSVTAVAQGSADPTRVPVVDHTAGDPATGLPDTSAMSLLVQPGAAYEVRFAWIPASGGGASGCQSTMTPPATATPTDGATAGGSTDGNTSPTTKATVTASPGITLTHTPEAGRPAASTTLADACAGTVYKTGILSAT